MHPSASPSRGQDWYSLLGLKAEATVEEIAAAVERLTRQASALAVTAPERSHELRERIRAIRGDLLSGDLERQRYDQSLARESELRAATAAAAAGGQNPAFPSAGGDARTPPAGPVAPRPPGLASRVARFLQTGWTCPACGHGAMPADKFCMKCGSKIQTIAAAGPPAHARQAGQPGQSAIQSAFCGSCSAALIPGNTFCTHCGTPRT